MMVDSKYFVSRTCRKQQHMVIFISALKNVWTVAWMTIFLQVKEKLSLIVSQRLIHESRNQLTCSDQEMPHRASPQQCSYQKVHNILAIKLADDVRTDQDMVLNSQSRDHRHAKIASLKVPFYCHLTLLQLLRTSAPAGPYDLKPRARTSGSVSSVSLHGCNLRFE